MYTYLCLKSDQINDNRWDLKLSWIQFKDISYPFISNWNVRILLTLKVIPGPSEARGAGGLQPPNNLLKFVDFVSEKAVKAKVVRIKIQTRISSRKLPESIQNATLLMTCKSKFQNFREKTIISCDPWLLSMALFPKMGRFPTI